MITKNSDSIPIELPTFGAKRPHQTLAYHFDVDYSLLKRSFIHLTPDDCLISMKVNDQLIDLSSYPRSSRCDWNNGFVLNLGEHLHYGTNHVVFNIRNHTGFHGLDLYHDGSDPMYHNIIKKPFILLIIILLLYPLYRIRQMHGSALIFAALTGYAAWLLFERLLFELSGVYTWDTPIYWGIGQGILNGLTPYQELFETKPPGIFLFAAFSLLIENSFFIGNVIQVIHLLLLIVAPVIGITLLAKTDAFMSDRWYHTLTALLFGLSLAHYSALRSGEIQVESLGAAWITVYATLLLLRQRFNTPQWFWLAASLPLLFGIGLKEPFVMIALAVSILLNDTIRSWIDTFLIPLVLAIIFAIIILLFMDSFHAYLENYLPFMLEDHVSDHGSPFDRALQVSQLYDDVKAYNKPLAWAIAGMLFVTMLNAISKFRSIQTSILIIAKMVFMLFLISFAIGMGGQFYNHHYVFAVPFYLALFFYLIKMHSPMLLLIRNHLIAAVVLLLSIGTLMTPHAIDYQYTRSLTKQVYEVQKEANYVDAVLNTTQQDRYLFIGGNGPQVYAFTDHSPLGPLFFQYDTWLDPKLPFLKTFYENLHHANLIIYDNIRMPSIRTNVDQYIAEHFTQQPWPAIRCIPREVYKYKIYFRKKLEGSSDQVLINASCSR